MVVIPLKKVKDKTSICTAQVYALMSGGNFPKPIKIGRRSAWIEAEIDEWLDRRIAERDAKAGLQSKAGL